jgi:carbamoyl-phosphate synthase large subunit
LRPSVDASVAAVRALGRRVTGAFSVDLKENHRGVPCVTEINAGRFITMMNFFDFAGKHNMTLAYVRLALGESVEVSASYDTVADHYFVRDVDALPGIFHADELFEGIHDARRSWAVAGRAKTGRR